MRFAASLEIDLPADIHRAVAHVLGLMPFARGRKRESGHGPRADAHGGGDVPSSSAGGLDALGIDNARFLVVDGVMVFEDARGHPSDLPDLMAAFADHVLVASEACRQLRLWTPCLPRLSAASKH